MQLYNKTCSQLCLRRIILKIFAKYMLTCPQHLPLNCWIWGIVLLTDCVCAHECTHSSFVDLEGRARNPWKRIHIRGRRWYHCLWTCVCVCVKIELERLTGQNLALAFESRLSFFLAENQIFIYLK